MSIHEALDLLGSIHDPLLQHQADRLGNLSAKGQLVELKRAGRILVDDLRKIRLVSSMIAEQSNLILEPISTVSSIISEFEAEFEELEENQIPFSSHSWHDVVSVFEIKSLLLLNSINQIIDRAKNSEIRNFSRLVYRSNRISIWLRRLIGRSRAASFTQPKK